MIAGSIYVEHHLLVLHGCVGFGHVRALSQPALEPNFRRRRSRALWLLRQLRWNRAFVLGAGVEHAFLLLLEVTLDGGDIWDCSSQSAYQVPECKALERGVLVSPLASSSLMAHPNACY